MPNPKRNDTGLESLSRYLRKPRTIFAIRVRFKVSERTAYRWMAYLREGGAEIVIHRTGWGASKITYSVPS